MNREVLYEAITNISDRFIEEADPDAGSGYLPRIRRLRPVLNTAAVLLVVIGLTAVALRSGLLSGARSEAPAADAAVAEAPMVAQYSLTMESAYDEAMPETEEAEYTAETAEDAPSALYTEAEPNPEPAAGEAPAAESDEMADGKETESLTDQLIRAGIQADDAELLASYPSEIRWNGVSYQLTDELLSELPSLAVSSGVLENTEDAEFFAPSEALLGMQVFVSAESDALYISFGEYWAVYEKAL